MSSKLGFFKGGSIGNRGGAGRRAHGGAASLNLTPMIDMFTILLVFLIKSYSTDPAFLTPTQNIELSKTTSEKIAPNEMVLIIGKDGILVEGKLVVAFKDGTIDSKLVKAGVLPELQKALEAQAAKTKFIAERNSSVKFSGTLILQADQKLPFDSLKPVLRTAGLVGYNDIKFAGLYED
jgi:biopolymer transport protein ExbD